jgi:hypothetical protein
MHGCFCPDGEHNRSHMPHRLTFVIPDLEHEGLKAMAEAHDPLGGSGGSSSGAPISRGLLRLHERGAARRGRAANAIRF